MEERSVYKDIENRTGGDIYVGVVGPVRTGKSTFIKQFMDTLVIPNITDPSERARAVDELPQSSAGRTIMTTEPKFVPENGVEITVDKNAHLKVRMIDCVGFIVDSASGYLEDNEARLVKTPWSDEEIPFRDAAEIGTRKVINEHSAIGILVTTDGSVCEIPREDYIPAEEKAVAELKSSGKPFVILLNTVDPSSRNSRALADSLTEKYGIPTLAVDCSALDENTIRSVLLSLLLEFPVKEVRVRLPEWIKSLDLQNERKSSLFSMIRSGATGIRKLSEVSSALDELRNSDDVVSAEISDMELGKGRADIEISLRPELFYTVLSERSGLDITNERDLLDCVIALSDKQKKFDKIESAYNDVMETGYGIVMPAMEELSLEEPRIVKQSGKYGVKLKASAPSIHMMRVRTNAEVTPIVGSEQQSEELVKYLLAEFEENPEKIWESDIFGKSVNELVNEGLHNKLYRMPAQARMKVGETIEKIINDGCNGLICIIL